MSQWINSADFVISRSSIWKGYKNGKKSSLIKLGTMYNKAILVLHFNNEIKDSVNHWDGRQSLCCWTDKKACLNW